MAVASKSFIQDGHPVSLTSVDVAHSKIMDSGAEHELRMHRPMG